MFCDASASRVVFGFVVPCSH